LETITELYSLPNYYEIDPTPILSIFYFIFFGLCLSDVGYGASIAILTYLAIKKLKLEGNTKKFLKLLYYCGISGIFGGIIMGSWFGDILNYLPPMFSSLRNFLIQKLALFEPASNPLPLLMLSLALGVIQIYTGIILKFLDNVRKGKLYDGLMDQIILVIFVNRYNFFIITTANFRKDILDNYINWYYNYYFNPGKNKKEYLTKNW
jgi:V/A-type H+-transporting ATPase subunit I